MQEQGHYWLSDSDWKTSRKDNDGTTGESSQHAHVEIRTARRAVGAGRVHGGVQQSPWQNISIVGFAGTLLR